MGSASIRGREVALKSESNSFKYKCLKCGSCCTTSKIRLNPYDLMILAKNLEVPVADIRKKFTYTIIDDQVDFLPVVILNTKGGCAFLDNDLCFVHSFRPIACRLHPLGMCMTDGELQYYVTGNNPCLRCKKRVTVKDFLDENIDQDSLDVAKRFMEFKLRCKKAKLPRKNPEFLKKYDWMVYGFDEKELSGSLEDKFYSIIEKAEQKLIEPCL